MTMFASSSKGLWYVLLLVIMAPYCIQGDHSSAQNTSVLLVISSSVANFNTSGILSSAVFDSALKSAHDVLFNTTVESSPSAIALDHVEEDAECNGNRAKEIVEDYLTRNDTSLAGIIGFGCSTATSVAMAELAPHLNHLHIPVVSYSSQSPELSGYSPLFRTTPTFNGLYQALLGLIETFDWEQVLFISQEINTNIQEFKTLLSLSGVSLHYQFINSTDVFSTSHRVYILDTYGPATRDILCQAYKKEVYYPSYAWILIDNFIKDDWFTILDTNCTTNELQRVLNYSIVVGTSPGNNREDLSMYMHDAVTALALATLKIQPARNASVIDTLKEVSFTGKSGEIPFQGKRNHSHIIFNQLRSSHGQDVAHLVMETVVVGHYQQHERGTVLDVNRSSNDIWPEGIPSDGVTEIVVETVLPWAFALSIVLSVLGIVFSVICFLFIFLFRKSKLIRVTSPNLNYLLLLGGCSVFISIIIYSYPSTDRHVFDVLCPIQPFFGSILGYDLCVTINTVKLWRLYYIFKGPNRNVPKDWQLIVVISIFLSIDCVFSVILTLVDVLWFPPKLIHEDKPDYTDLNTGQVYSFFFWDCRYSTYVFLLVALAHNFVVHGIGIGFAFKLRKIEVTVLNEYKYNLAILFTSVAVTLITVICNYSIGPDPSLYAFLYSLLISVGCITFIGLTFIPKMIALKQDPNGDKLFPNTVGNSDIKKAYDLGSIERQSVSAKAPSSLTSPTLPEDSAASSGAPPMSSTAPPMSPTVLPTTD